MTDREIMQQALDALKIAEVDGNCYYEATELLRKRLAQRKPLTTEAIRAAGGIVHKDGNVFFTNLEQLNQAIEAAHGIKEKNT
jgi:hypothetical protein